MSRENNKKPNFSWKKNDFTDNNVEIPNSLLNDDVHTEGEKLSEQEIIDWVLDTQKTFCIIREQDEKRYEELYQDFLLDLEYLIKIGKIDEDSLDTILDPDLYHF
jgi:hypothetical protein